MIMDTPSLNCIQFFCLISLRLNTFCIINVCLIPSGDSDSLWYSYSSAYTAFGYQNVITMITGAESLYKMNGFHIHIIL